LLNEESHIVTSELINSMFHDNVQPLILQPTRATDSTANLIDNIFSNDLWCSATSGNILVQVSDHFPQFSTFKNHAPEYNNSSYFASNCNTSEVSQLLDDYLKMDFIFLDSEDYTVDLRCDKFLTALNQLVAKHCPKKRLNKNSLKLRNKPRINSPIRHVMRIRDRISHHFK